MDAAGGVGSSCRCLTLVVVSGLDQQHPAGEEGLQKFSAECLQKFSGCCIRGLGLVVKCLPVVLQAAGLPLPASPVVSVLGLLV